MNQNGRQRLSATTTEWFVVVGSKDVKMNHGCSSGVAGRGEAFWNEKAHQ